jgi:signal transduction histidine kinase
MRERVEYLNGQFHITSAPGGGSTLHIRVPVYRAEAEDRS